jgi:outer membrane protein OmpA-like peptidoglycan-associated protein
MWLLFDPTNRGNLMKTKPTDLVPDYAELAKHRAQSVRDALVAGGVAAERIKFRKPESTLGAGSPEEGRRVEIRVQ